MRLSIITLVFGFISLAQAVPFAIPTENEFELVTEVRQLFQERFLPSELEEFDNVINKRDTVLSIETLLNLVNNSGIIYTVLDLVAYSPSRIEALANLTAGLVGNVNTSDLLGTVSSLGNGLNYSAMFTSVMESGVVTSLLDGILLDEDFRPTLVDLISRILEGNKNLFLYLVQDVFKSLKRDELHKRATGSLETFVGNIVALALGSDLVGNLANDVLTALNNTQFLTYTAKELIGNEGYQNMTAQFVIDIIRSGKLQIDSQPINVTRIADKALSNPDAIVSVLSLLLMGNIQLDGLGKYNDAIRDIIKDVEDQGVFADLNNYVFSESHTVSKPLIPTTDIVVPRTPARNTVTTTSTTRSTTFANSSMTMTSSSRSRANGTSTTSPRTTTFAVLVSVSTSENESAAEVASILSVLRSSMSMTVTTSTPTTRSGSGGNNEDSFDFDELLEQLSASEARATETETETLSYTTSVNGDNLFSLLAELTTTQNRAAKPSTTESSTLANMGLPNNSVTKTLVYLQMLLLGGVFLL